MSDKTMVNDNNNQQGAETRKYPQHRHRTKQLYFIPHQQTQIIMIMYDAGHPLSAGEIINIFLNTIDNTVTGATIMSGLRNLVKRGTVEAISRDDGCKGRTGRLFYPIRSLDSLRQAEMDRQCSLLFHGSHEEMISYLMDYFKYPDTDISRKAEECE